MIAEGGFHHLAHRAVLEAKGHLLEGLDHLPTPEATQVATLLGAGASRLRPGEFGKIGAALDLGEDVIRLLLGGLFLLGSRLGIGTDQNVAGLDRFRLRELIRVRVIKLLGLLGGQGDLGRDLLVDVAGNEQVTGQAILEFLPGQPRLAEGLLEGLGGAKPRLGGVELLLDLLIQVGYRKPFSSLVE